MRDTDELMARAEIMLEIVLYEQLMARRGWLARLLNAAYARLASRNCALPVMRQGVLA